VSFSPFAALLALVLAILPAPALAQPPSGPPDRVDPRAVDLGGGAVARLVSTWSMRTERNGLTLDLGSGQPTVLARGNAAGAIEMLGADLLVAYAVPDRRAPFRVRIARRERGRFALGEAREIARPGPAAPAGGGRTDDQPFAVAIAPLADGCAVFFQEVQTDDPSAAHTYLVQLDRAGAPREAAREIAVPWALAAAAWNGHGYHLALYFSGYGEGMRLSMVSLAQDGTPEQHPDWASAAGYIADVHLVAREGRVRAYYRGGRGGDRLLETDVTQIRSWGQEPSGARDHGALESDAAILVSGDRVRGVRQP
jgi:hypothetical protein